MADNGQKEKLSLVKIKSAQQQVVAGMNYFLTMQVRVGDEEKTAEAIVFMQPWRNKVELTSWKLIDPPADPAADDHPEKDD